MLSRTGAGVVQMSEEVGVEESKKMVWDRDICKFESIYVCEEI